MTFKTHTLLCLILVQINSLQPIISQSLKNQNNNENTALQISPNKSVELDIKANESSGLFFWNDTLWTHNDNKDITFYALDPENGKVIRTIALDIPVANDWEATTQDADFLYLGDFGNNVSGIRTDLKIFKISKQSIQSGKPKIDTIAFNYQDQDTLANATSITDFDCEAFIFLNDSLYLFTKQWKSTGTTVYALPTSKGKHRAKPVTSYNVNGLVTDACYNEKHNTIVLIMYSTELQPYILILNHFENSQFFDGNVTTLQVMLPFYQMEGIATEDGLQYYVSNETFNFSLLNIPAKLCNFNLQSFIISNPEKSNQPEKKTSLIYPNPFTDHLIVEFADNMVETSYSIYDGKGSLVKEGWINNKENHITTNDLIPGVYTINLSNGLKNYALQIINAR